MVWFAVASHLMSNSSSIITPNEYNPTKITHMSNKFRQLFTISLASVVASAAVFLVSRQEASAGVPAITQVCFRGRTLTINPTLLAQYIAAGATFGACGTSPSLQ